MITLTIDSKTIQVERGSTVLDAAKAAGIDIPTLCHHKEILPYGACRLCTVEIVKGKDVRLHASCAYPAEDGMIVNTSTEKVKRGRKLMLEFLLARCPEVWQIRMLANKMGIRDVRFSIKKEICILCGLCVRVCHEVVGTGAIGFAGRGIERRVIPPFEKFPEVCLGCGACSFVCPTGTMKMEYEATKQFRDIPGSDRLCRYARMQVIPYKLCSNNYQCRHCEVDQLMEDRFGTHPVIATKPITRKMKQYVGEFSFMPDRYYWRGHVWMRFLNGKVQVGLDDFARRILSCIDEIRLPPSDRTIGRFEKAWEIACGSKRATMLLPIAGRISDVNPDVLDVPELIERDPYGRGWILTVEPTNIQDEILHLYDGSSKQVYDWLTLESDKLHRLIKTKTRVIMTDGGVLQSDLPNRLTDDEWTTLTKEFFLH